MGNSALSIIGTAVFTRTLLKKKITAGVQVIQKLCDPSRSIQSFLPRLDGRDLVVRGDGLGVLPREELKQRRSGDFLKRFLQTLNPFEQQRKVLKVLLAFSPDCHPLF
jgi:hypothetical protein